jgi:hypothetical protein
VSEKKSKPEDRWQRKVALATNAGGTIAGPAAIWMAINQAKRKEGGMPTEAARALHSSHPGKVSGKILRTLRNPKMVAAGGVTAVGLQSMNTVGDATATTELMRQRRLQTQAHKEKASKSMDSFTDIYVSKAAQGTGHGKKLETAMRDELSDDPSIDARYNKMREKDLKMNGRRGAAAGGIQGAAAGGLVGGAPGYLRGSSKLMAGGAAGGALAGGVALGALARSATRKKVKGIYDNPAVEYQVKRNMGLSDAAKRALENRKAAQAAALSEVGKRYFDAEADRQRRLGLYAGLGGGAALALGAGAATQLEGAKVPMMDRPLPDGPNGEKRYKKAGVIRTKANKSGRLGAALAGGSALSALAGGAAYKRGISERNQPWN